MSLGRPPAYRFAGFLLDMARRQLSRDGVEIPLRSKDFEVLALLVEHHDRAVSKDELFARVWPGQIVDDNNLPRHISTLRRVLSAHGGEERCIQTLPGWGYRLAAPVSRAEESRVGEDGIEPVPSAPSEVPPTGDVAVAVAPPARTPTVLVTDAAGSRVSWRAMTGAAVAAVVLVVAGVVWFARDTTVAGNGPSASRSLRQITWDQGQQDEPTWSPDGRSLAFASDQARGRDIYRLDLDTGAQTLLIDGPGHDWQPAWSPDGRHLAFRSERDDGGIYVARADGSAVRRVLDFGYRPQWAPDGTHLLVSTGIDGQGEPARPFVVRLDNGVARPLAPEGLAAYRSLQAAWHPDGRRIFVWGSHPDLGWRFLAIDAGADDGVAEVAIDEAVAREIESLGLALNRFVWAPSGRFLYFEGVAERVSSVWRIGVDPDTGRWHSGPDRLTTGAGQDRGIAVSPDGRRLTFGILSARRQVWALPLDAATGRIAEGGRTIDLGASDPVNLSVASDGRRLVYRTMRGEAAEIRARLMANGREDVVLTGMGTSPPHLSLDGTRLAYTRAAASASEPALRDVVVRAVDGGAERAIARLGRLFWSTTDWTPDGRALVGTCREMSTDVRSKVCVMPIDGAPDAEQHVQVLASDPRRNLFVPRFSPDMRWISFIASDAGRSTVYVMPARGGPWTALTDGRFQEDKLRWSPDSGAVYFVSNRSGFLNVWMRRIDASGRPSGDLIQVTDFTTMKRMLAPALGGLEFAIVHDQLVLPLSEAHSRVWMLEGVDR